MSSKRKFPGLEEQKENSNEKGSKKINKGSNLFSFFKKTPKNSKAKLSNSSKKKEDPPIKENTTNKTNETISTPLTNFMKIKNDTEIIPKNELLKKKEEKKMPTPSPKKNEIDFKKLELPDFLTKKEASYKIMNLSDQIAKNTSQNVLSKTFWSTGSYSQSFPFFLVSESLDAASKQKGENSMRTKKEIISKLISEAITQSPSEVFILYNFLTCRFDADFMQKDVQIGNETILKIVGKLSGKSIKTMRESFRKIGDLGSLAEESRANQKTISTFFVPVKTRDMNMKVTMFNCFSIIKGLSEIRKWI